MNAKIIGMTAAISLLALPLATPAEAYIYSYYGAPYPYYYAPGYYPYYAYPQPYAYAPPPAEAQPQQPVYQDAQGQYCREYTQTINVDGRSQPAYGTVCQQPDGTWKTAN